jgi:hypothetical protein
VLGSLIGMGVIFGRAWHVPELLLLAAAMIPLSLLVTVFEEYRTAPVAAIIILSSGSALISPLHVALLRLVEVTIGSLSSALIGAVVLPSRGHGRVFRMAASILSRIGAVLESSLAEQRDNARIDAAHEDIRRDLRELATLVRSKGAPGTQGRVARLLSRLQADASFVARVVRAGVRRDSAVEYGHGIHRVCRDLADCMVETDSTEELRRCAGDLKAASETFSAARSAGVDSVDALDFLLETLGKDLQDLVRVLLAHR